ncbi:hypothetical protein [Streptomyces rubiginosohelvolus]|uniref:hypothetical protein n=1 Tax=Streptomyces rubiginosohelvolus TaxID=67362 RepID=UPI00368C72B6
MAASFETKLTAAATVVFALVTTVAATAMAFGDPNAINGVIGAGFGTIITGLTTRALYRLDRDYPH